MGNFENPSANPVAAINLKESGARSIARGPASRSRSPGLRERGLHVVTRDKTFANLTVFLCESQQQLRANYIEARLRGYASYF